MFKPRAPRPWTCSRCLRLDQKRLSKRCLVTSAIKKGSTSAAAADALPNHDPIDRSEPSISQDDRALRQIFDSPSFWKEFSSKAKSRNGGRNAGLFQNRYLTRPEGFQDFAATTVQKCQRIVASVLEYHTVEQYKTIARDLDRLSDLLCRVIDLSDFIRAVHPDRQFQLAAHQAYMHMFEYMNVLNTTTGLNEQLKTACALPEVWNSWSEEEKTVADILARDFSKSAIDLQETDREKFVQLSNEIAHVGSEFVEKMAADQPYLTFESSAVKGMDPLTVRQLSRWGKVTLPLVGAPPAIALRSVENPDVRREIYMAHRTSSEDSINRLERLLKRRAELAKLSGFESYAHMTLSEKMSKSPEAVNSFLSAVARDNAPRVKAENGALLDLKRASAQQQDASQVTLDAWDRDYYVGKMISLHRSRSRTPDFLSAYFSLGTVMQGLSRLYHRLYGIRLVPRENLPGETWNTDVRCLDVVDDIEGHIAVIYCDLFEREGKSPNPAHFTLRCSRRISEEELHDAVPLTASSDSIFSTPQEAVTDGLATSINKRDSNALYQLPTIALICDFASSKGAGVYDKPRPALLSFQEVRTLFHEMGHALHSICGRTALQNVAGTRCATDFAELPSVLNESFASAPEVLGLFARHWETDDPLNVERVHEKVVQARRMEGAEIESQVLLGSLDQHYHSSLPLTWPEGGQGSSSSTEVFHDVWRQYSNLLEPTGTSYQGFFGHLYGYGATYYSYLFDRAIAGKIWRDVFQRRDAGPLSPEAGRRYREEVLRWGGGRDGWRCVGGVLGGAEEAIVREGGERAMQRVGSWGVHDSWG